MVRCNRIDEPIRRFAWGLRGLLLVAVFVGGCRLGVSRVVPCPLAAADQKTALLKIAPLGTPRDEAIQKFNKAGIEGSFGISETVYYCDFWNRPNGERWKLDLSMLFDQSGQLYAIRATSFFAGTSSANAANGSAGIEDRKNPVGRLQTEPDAGPTGLSSTVEDSVGTGDRNSVRSGRRTPFVDESDIR